MQYTPSIFIYPSALVFCKLENLNVLFLEAAEAMARSARGAGSIAEAAVQLQQGRRVVMGKEEGKKG